MFLARMGKDESRKEAALKEREANEAKHEAELLRNELENIYVKLEHAK